jgi:hypothetical protein
MRTQLWAAPLSRPWEGVRLRPASHRCRQTNGCAKRGRGRSIDLILGMALPIGRPMANPFIFSPFQHPPVTAGESMAGPSPRERVLLTMAKVDNDKVIDRHIASSFEVTERSSIKCYPRGLGVCVVEGGAGTPALNASTWVHSHRSGGLRRPSTRARGRRGTQSGPRRGSLVCTFLHLWPPRPDGAAWCESHRAIATDRGSRRGP